MPQRPKIANDMLELIGYTPLVRLNRIPYPDSAELIAKLESQNPMDSVKDRIGAAMIKAAEHDGIIKCPTCARTLTGQQINHLIELHPHRGE